MANINMDLRDWLCKQIEEADVDMLRQMVSTMAEELMTAEVTAICGAEYRERTEDRVNSATVAGLGPGTPEWAPSIWPSPS